MKNRLIKLLLEVRRKVKARLESRYDAIRHIPSFYDGSGSISGRFVKKS